MKEVSPQIKIEHFEGPFRVLVQLIEEHELSITKVSLASVADQYLSYLRERRAWDPEELADFLVVAAKLIYLKSKSLLPTLHIDEEEQETEALERQLLLYKQYRDATHHLRARVQEGMSAYARERSPMMRERRFLPPHATTATMLRVAFERVLRRLEHIIPSRAAVVRRTISIREKIHRLQQLIMENVSLPFSQFTGGKHSKVDLVVSFLAVLELMKQHIASADQEHMFGEITIRRHMP